MTAALLLSLLIAVPSVAAEEPTNSGRDRALGWHDAGLVLGGAAGYLGLHKLELDLALIDWEEPPAGKPWREDSVPTSSIIVTGFLLAGLSAAEGGHAEAVGMAQAGLVTAAVTNVLKLLIGRPRPDYQDRMSRDYEDGAQRDKEHGDARLSMPSGHSSAAFAFATQTGRWLHRAGCQRGWGRPARLAGYLLPFGLAGAVAWTRVSDNRHYPSDVLAGAALGSGVAYALDRWQNGAAPCP